VYELAILLLAVDHEQQPDNLQEGHYPVIVFDPVQGTDWQQVKEALRESGASRILLQFSHESLTIPPHSWNLTDCCSRRYRRLYHAEDILASASPFVCVELYETLPLPDLSIHTRPILHEDQGYDLNRLLYYFDTRQWEMAEQLLSEADPSTEQLFARSCYYGMTNRYEEAFAASLQALSHQNHQDPAGLWLIHGIHAAKCGRSEEAAIAFRMSYNQGRQTGPLYYWADELMQQGKINQEIIAAIGLGVPASPEREEHLICLMLRIGAYDTALEALEQQQTSAPRLNMLRFDALLGTGRIAEAAMLFQEQQTGWDPCRLPMDDLLCKLILADNEVARMASPLTPYQLESLQERAVSLGLHRYAEELQPFMPEPLSIAFALFRSGYVMRAAAFFLQAMQTNALDSRGLRCLGEILYYRGAYVQASGMFEYLLSQTPEDPALRTALALACLRQSEGLLDESMHIFPSSVFLREEAEKVAAGIRRMEQSKAITRWHWAQRNHFHE
jgi:tetratricopeptide (TPR) repeat protein